MGRVVAGRPSNLEVVVMRVFVTGASGWIGSAVVPELLSAGHEVVGLARSDASAAAVQAAGAEVVRGSLGDLDGLAAAASAADGVVHLAYRHDLSFSGEYARAAEVDTGAVVRLGEALAGSGGPLLIASGTAGFTPGTLATEEDEPDRSSGMAGRLRSEDAAFALAERGVRSMVVRLAPTVHGAGDYGFMAVLTQIARERGVSAYIADGANRWPAVHRSDAARLIRLGIESAPAGTPLHAVGEEGVPIKAVAEAIGRGLDLPVASIAPEEAAEHFGWLAGFLALDIPTSSALTQERLGWEPAGPTLLEDLEAGHYFGSVATA
jgi:nucleoside-diphosphate-sugar epimerase